MNRYAFLSCILAIAIVLLQVYGKTKESFSPKDEYRAQIARLNVELKRSHLREAVLTEQFREFRNDVALVLPPSLRKVTQKGRDYPLRNLASVMMQKDGEKLGSMMAATLFETGRSLFRKGEYDRANRLFKKVIERYGYLTQAVEAHFLLAEGQYQLGDIEGASQTVGKMVDLFPDSELTGFALIRLGKILESRERYEEAVEVYRTVLRSFPYRSVAGQAEASLREMEH